MAQVSLPFPVRTRSFLVVAVSMAALMLSGNAAAGSSSVQIEKFGSGGLAPHVPGQLLVGLSSEVSTVASRRLHRAVVGARSVHRLGGKLDLVTVPKGLSLRRAIARLESDPRVAYAEPNYLRERYLTTNDTFFTHLWAFSNSTQQHVVSDAFQQPTAFTAAGTNDADMDVTEAWDTSAAFGANTLVAVIDDGVQVTHQDLAGQFWTNPGEGASPNGLDDDGNGKVDDIRGWDFANNDSTLLAPASVPGGNTHGTHVAGTIAAAANNSLGIAGVCPSCDIMGLKVMRDSDGVITDAWIVTALNYAKAKGAKVVNMSLGGPAFSMSLRNAIKNASFLAVIAAGNSSLDNDVYGRISAQGRAAPSYPASFTLPNILAVAASNHNDQFGFFTGCDLLGGNTPSQCAFTSWGHDSVDIAAPGVDIASSVTGCNTSGPPSGDGGCLSTIYASFNGTSMATPNTAGLAGLVRGARPSLTAVETKNAIMRGTDKPATLRTLISSIFVNPVPNGSFILTNGRANANNALTAGVGNATPLSDGNINGARLLGGALRAASSAATVSGSLRWGGDANDVYKRTLGPGRYRLTLTGQAGRNFDLYVYKPGTLEIWQTSQLLTGAAGAGPTERVTFNVPTRKTYYFQANAFYPPSSGAPNAGNYTLKLQKL